MTASEAAPRSVPPIPPIPPVPPAGGLGPAGRLTANQQDRRRRVIDAAVALAAAGGYDVVQIRDVATRARVALGTIYRYFESKDQLLAAALVEWAHGLEQRLAERPPVGETAEDRVVDVLRRASRSIERNQQLSSALVTAIASPDEGIHRYQAEIDDMIIRVLRGRGRRHRRGTEGRGRPDPGPCVVRGPHRVGPRLAGGEQRRRRARVRRPLRAA